MADRIVDISDLPGKLYIKLDNLILDVAGDTVSSIPVTDIAALVIANPQVTLTQAVMAKIAASGGIIVSCDERFQPAAMMLPLDAHYSQSERFRMQAKASLPTQKRIWQKIIVSKIKTQGKLLSKSAKVLSQVSCP